MNFGDGSLTTCGMHKSAARQLMLVIRSRTLLSETGCNVASVALCRQPLGDLQKPDPKLMEIKRGQISSQAKGRYPPARKKLSGLCIAVTYS